MSEERAERCETCKFWRHVTADESGAGPTETERPPFASYADYPQALGCKEYDLDLIKTGECHRNAPVSVLSFQTKENGNWPEGHEVCWPITLPLDWCGEWQQRAGQ